MKIIPKNSAHPVIRLGRHSQARAWEQTKRVEKDLQRTNFDKLLLQIRQRRF